MTEEERKRLVARLRAHEVVMWTDIDLAADEIERLAALAQSDAESQGVRALEAKCYAEGFADGKKATLAQSEAEPVICPNCGVSVWPDIDAAVKAGLAWRNPAPDAAPSVHSNTKTVTIGPTIPPRLDASEIAAAMDRVLERRGLHTTSSDASAGLIEAAELAEQVAAEYSDAMARLIAHDIADHIRARAAERSGK